MKHFFKKLVILQSVILVSMLLINCAVESKIIKSFHSGNELVKYLNDNSDTINKNVLYYDSDFPVSMKNINLNYNFIDTENNKNSYISSNGIDYINEENTIDWYGFDYLFVSYFFDEDVHQLSYSVDENYYDEKTIFNKLVSVYNDTLLVGEIFIFDNHNFESDRLINFLKSKIILITKETKLNEKIIIEPEKCNTYYELSEYLQFYTSEIKDTFGKHMILNFDEQFFYNFKYDFTNRYQNLKFDSYGKILLNEEMIECTFESFYTKEKIVKEELELKIFKINNNSSTYLKIAFYMQNELLSILTIDKYENIDILLSKIKENIIIG